MISPKHLLFFFLIFSIPLHAQKLKKDDKVLISNLQTHISYLADDKLEGRQLGSTGEKLAMEYIRTQFEKNGLSPKGNEGSYYQPFDISEGRNFENNSYLHINGVEINPGDFYPLPGSPNITLESSPSIALKESGVPWFLDLKDDLNAVKNNSLFNLNRFLIDKTKQMSRKGATALFVYNSNAQAQDGKYDPGQTTDSSVIPIIMVSHKIAGKFFADETATLLISLKIAFQNNIRTGHNVLGFINNGASTTVCLGAHFDHLGYGENGGSLLQTKEHLIHNGADDNASGIAALIELSRLLKQSRYKSNNYLFMAFSGEEMGLLGSKYFVEHPTIDLSSANFMINMDMVGRLNENKILTVGGYGTSETWPPLFNRLNKNNNIITRFDSSGTGPSDHTSFYSKKIPVLFFFTGTHGDYHKPSDDADKINYSGENYVVRYIYQVIAAVNKQGRLGFTATRDTHSATATTFSVTMGIMPDYSFNGAGVRVDAVSEGRPAQKSGLTTGDVIVQLGPYPVSSLQDYMQALNNFKKGDKTKVIIKRVQKTIEAEVIF